MRQGGAISRKVGKIISKNNFLGLLLLYLLVRGDGAVLEAGQ